MSVINNFKNLSKLDKVFVVWFILVLISLVDSSFIEFLFSILGLLFWYIICRIIKNKFFIKTDDKNIIMPEHVIIHLDTTGLNSGKDEILKITALRVINGEIKDVFNEYIKPKFKISDEITKINGISNEMVEHSKTIEEVLPNFKKFLRDDDFLVGYNVQFCINFLRSVFIRISKAEDYFNYNSIDVLTLVKIIINKRLPSRKLSDVAKALKIKNEASTLNIDKNTYFCFKVFNYFKKNVVNADGNWNIKFLKDNYILDEKMEL